ncbi:TPA: fimbrial protein [Escherichia coli]|nr:fimbrial protein [Escherichia coli]HCO5224138.1 fimbrial protein [Escherichia coli]HCO5233280.1 fimbrial protein [Escherichia coli]HCO7193711.1 fimbrial protein [Escherichia coli]HDD8776104.1 fimbrial protein [Escherichia coli]
MQRKGNNLLIQLCSAILLFFTTSWYALANECYIESNAEGSYDMVINPTPFSIQTRMVDAPEEIAFATWDSHINLRGDKIGCKSLGSNTSSVHFLNTADASLLSTYTNNHGGALLKATVPGIVYSVELVCTSCGVAEELDLYLPAQSGADNHTDNANAKWAYEYSDDSWFLRFRFFWTPEFKPQTGVSEGFAMPGKIASWYIGNNDQPWINFFVDTSAVHFYVDEPTCATVALAQDQGNVSGNQVTLGNSYVSEVKNGLTREIPFSIRAEYCYASKITIKLKAANKPSDGTLVGKTTGSASGVAVKVNSTYDNSKVLLKADGSNAVDYNFAIWSNNLLNFPFTAQLVPDGSGAAVGVGTFSGNATFSFTYE